MMDVGSIANLATSLTQATSNQEIGLAVFKKALDAEKAVATALIAALPPVPSAVNLPAHLGQNVNTVA